MRTYHAGRLIDHVHFMVADLRASIRFYGRILDVLEIAHESGDGWFQADELFLSHGNPPTRKLHLAFQAPDRTLTDEEALALRERIVAALADRFAAELRG